jgi:RNA polymerase sigma-70 factor (sigma-E family)
VRFEDLDSEFDDFVKESSNSLLRTAYLLVGDRGHAEDLLQTALLRTARRWGAAQTNPSAYARRVLVNLAKDSWRNYSRRPAETVLDDLVAHPDDDGAHARFLLRQTLLRAVATLPPRQRAVLVLRFFDDLSVDETAAALACSVGTVKSQTHHALARLRTLLADDGLEVWKDEETCRADR